MHGHFKLTQMSNPLKKRHTKHSGCDLTLPYSLLLNAVREQQQWTSFGHSIKVLYLPSTQSNLGFLQDWISLSLFCIVFRYLYCLFAILEELVSVFHMCIDMCNSTHFSMPALTFLTPFGWLNTVLVSACRQYVNTLITIRSVTCGIIYSVNTSERCGALSMAVVCSCLIVVESYCLGWALLYWV